MRLASGIGLLLVLAGAPAMAVTQARIGLATSASDRLVAAMLDETLTVDQLAPGWARYVREDPRLGALARRDPAFVAYSWTRLRPALVATVRNEVPGLRRQGSAVLSRHLTVPEMGGVADFIATPVGNRIWRLGAEAASFPSAQREAMFASRMRAIMAAATASDKQAMSKAAPALAKLDRAGPAFRAAIGARMERAMQQARPRLAAIAQAAGRDYAAAHGGA